MPLTWYESVRLWKDSELAERSGYQHFNGICEILGQPTPAASDQIGDTYTFEKHVANNLGGTGFANVWKRGHFAWEYKRNHSSLSAAYKQLLDYRENLENPPLLIVSDFERFEVHTNWTNTPPRIYKFTLQDLLRHEPTATCPIPPTEVLAAVFRDPESLRPEKMAERVTRDAAQSFSQLAERLELEGPHRLTAEGKEEVAHFLMRLLFCLFADSIGLLPDSLFREMVSEERHRPQNFLRKLRALFAAMAAKGSFFGPYDIQFFNGGLFDDDRVLELTTADLAILHKACALDWSTVEPAIFGTLFERSLNRDKRKLIGAHYTSSADIRLVVEPVVVAPLRRRWEDVKAEVNLLAEQAKTGNGVSATNGQGRRLLRRQMEDKLVCWIEELAKIKVLDPACGSGNFLYVALRSLLDLWLEARTFAGEHGLATFLPETVSPRQLYGVETDFYAHELTSVVVWIGYLQWRHENSMGTPSEPVLEKLTNIEHGDAVLRYDANGKPYEPEWPVADFIVSNPPFLGGNKIRQELGDKYVDDLFALYSGRIGAFSDFVCYWFEKARAQVEAGHADRVGLLGTQGIRGGVNRDVLNRIKASGDIFLAWSDRDWLLDGAAVHISIVAFDDGTESVKVLDGEEVAQINADLSGAADTAGAAALHENARLWAYGSQRKGSFDIPEEVARKLLRSVSSFGRDLSEVVRPGVNGQQLLRSRQHGWVIDFGENMPLSEALSLKLRLHMLTKL
jgi:type II restriction/modification system DNA methylase subunit YeeA